MQGIEQASRTRATITTGAATTVFPTSPTPVRPSHPTSIVLCELILKTEQFRSSKYVQGVQPQVQSFHESIKTFKEYNFKILPFPNIPNIWNLCLRGTKPNVVMSEDSNGLAHFGKMQPQVLLFPKIPKTMVRLGDYNPKFLYFRRLWRLQKKWGVPARVLNFPNIPNIIKEYQSQAPLFPNCDMYVQTMHADTAAVSDDTKYVQGEHIQIKTISSIPKIDKKRPTPMWQLLLNTSIDSNTRRGLTSNKRNKYFTKPRGFTSLDYLWWTSPSDRLPPGLGPSHPLLKFGMSRKTCQQILKTVFRPLLDRALLTSLVC